MISYAPLFKTLEEKEKTQYWMMTYGGIGKSTFDRIKKGESLNLSTIEKMCNLLDCSMEDIVIVKADKKKA